MKKVLSILLCLATLIGSFSVCSVSANADSSLSSGDISTENFDSLLIPDEIVIRAVKRPEIKQYIGSDYCEAYGLLLSDIEIFPDMEADVVTDEMKAIYECFDTLLIWLKLANPKDMSNALKSLLSNPEVENVVQNFHIYPDEVTDTANATSSGQWAWDIIGTQEAWNMGFTGSSDITVAVLDTGVALNHSALELNVDYDNGYNEYDQNTNVADVIDHGTGVVGVIGADYNDGIIKGVCKNINILPIRISKPNGISDYNATVRGIQRAIAAGASIINFSFGLSENWVYTPEREILTELNHFNGLFITSAGNNGMLVSEDPENAGKTTRFNWIVVGNTDYNDEIYCESNYHPTIVQLFAPGTFVHTTSSSGGYDSPTGTSLSAPHVAAACALIMSHAPHLSAIQVKNLILENVDIVESLSGLCSTGGRLAIDKAIIALYNQSRPSYSKGDLNGDGTITVSDYALAKRIVLGTYTPSATEISAADINGNGSVDVTDYALIQRYYNKTFYFSPF